MEIKDYGYDILSLPRKGRGGGVAFLFDPQRVSPMKNKTNYYSSFEVLECVIKTKNDLLRLCVVYRSTQVATKASYLQTRTSLFFEQFNDYLDDVQNKSGRPIIVGDFNFHVEDKDDLVAQRFITLCKSKGFKQHVESPTHTAGGTLDLILTAENATDSVNLSHLEVDPDTGTTSDHFLLTFSVPLELIDASGETYEKVSYREFKKIDMDVFKSDISMQFCALDYTSVERTTDDFFRILAKTVEMHAPLKTRVVKKNKNPWWSQRCNDARNMRRKAERKYKKNRCQGNAKAYGEARIDAAIIINQERNRYFKKKLENVVGNPRETYRIINHLLEKEQRKSYPTEVDDKTVAEKFGAFFNKKVKDIYSEIEKTASNSNLRDYHDSSVSPSISSFQEISNEDLLKVIHGLPNKQCATDPIPAYLLKECSSEILPVINYIVNESLQTGFFPPQLKSAIVSPILKKPDLDPDTYNNYRPVSCLSYLSKIIEKCVHLQLSGYLEKHDLLSHFQSGYRKNFSCETAITRIYNDILLMVDSRTNVLLMLLDLSAAFDTIHHGLLLKKLESYYGVRGYVLQWLESYLAERTFKVKVKESFSGDYCLDIGVPQGSILGPLLFIMYTKDLNKLTSRHNVQIHFYADDTQVYASFDVHADEPNIDPITNCYTDIKNWMQENFLKMNENKTELLEIGPYQSQFKELKLGESTISLVSKAKNLGFVFDDSLSMQAHISSVAQKCNMSLRNLRRIASQLSQELKIQLVHSCIFSHLDYCNAVLGGISVSQLMTLQKLQNSAVRFIFNLKKREHIKPYLKKVHFLPVKERIDFKIALLTFKAINHCAPSYLKDLISLKDPNTSYSLRINLEPNILKPTKPLHHFKLTESAFSIKAPQIWNSLPSNLRSEKCLSKFKSGLKTFMFQNAFKNTEDI